jgi:hypothetical protein
MVLRQPADLDKPVLGTPRSGGPLVEGGEDLGRR